MKISSKLNELKPSDLNCNVFDVYSYDCLSMQDLLCQFFTKINECVSTSNEVIDLTDWLIKVGLEEEVVKKLMELMNNGTVEKLINVNLFNSLNNEVNRHSSQLAHIESEKMDVNTTDISIYQINKNKGKIDQTYLTDELLSQISGDAPIYTVPSNLSITEDKLVSKYATIQLRKNLFNKKTITKGYYIDYRNGNEVSADGFFYSDYIRVKPSTVYTCIDLNQVAYYNKDKEFIGGDVLAPFTTPSEAYFLRFCSKIRELDNQQLEENVTNTYYVDYKESINENHFTPENLEKINEELKEMNKNIYPILNIGKNLFNKNSVVKGKYIDATTGVIKTSEWFSYSDYIEVEEDTDYAIHSFNQIAFYNLDKKFIGGVTSITNDTFRTPLGVKYIRVVTGISSLDIQQLEKGAVKTNYEEFKLKIDNKYIDNNVSNEITITPNDDIINLLLNNQGKTIYVSDGEYDIIKIYENYFGKDFFDNFTPVGAPRLHFGLPLTNGTKLICSPNSHFSCHYTGNNNNVKWRFSAFACGNGYELNGLNIEASNIQYAIHDDYNEYIDTPYYVKVENCCIINNNQAIGGGLGKYGTYEYKNNFIHATNNSYDMRYHNNKNNSRCKLSFVGNYFPNTLRLSYYGDSPKDSTKCFVSNNFIGKPILNDAEDVNFTINNMKVYQWNNSSD